MRLQKAIGDRLHVQIDLAHQDFLRSNPSSVYAEVSLTDQIERPFADILSPLIIEADGTVVPIQHGLAREYALGNLQEASLRELTTHWYRERYPSFLKLCRCVFEEVTTPADCPITNWYEAIARQAENGVAIVNGQKTTH